MRRLFMVLPVAALAGVGAAAEPTERLPIVDRAIEHHGGEIYSRSETRLELCSKSGCFDVRARLDGGLYELEAAGRSRGVERRVRTTNDVVEWWRDGERQELGDQEARLRDWVMERVYFTFLPFRLNDPSVFKQDLGIEEWDGRPLHKVKVTFAPGSSTDAQDEFMYWFDPESARIEQFAYSYERGNGGLRFRRAFNYRRIGGILFFDQENLGAEGQGLSVDLVDPGYVAASLRPVSTVELRDIRVTSLER